MALVDSAATPHGLVADLLFGAPAEQGRPWFRPGVLELVAGGTVILEEVCHLPEAAKAKLLKALGQPSMRRRSSGPARTWVISTCNIDMDEAIRRGYFGRALFRRLAAVRIVMPPLRQCGNDVLVIADWLLPRICAQHHRPLLTLAPEVGPRFLRYGWPGNVRELTHMLTRAALLTAGSVISVKNLDLPPHLGSA
jgi:anaerobic nitric oxide reductase transcription regulator